MVSAGGNVNVIENEKKLWNPKKIYWQDFRLFIRIKPTWFRTSWMKALDSSIWIFGVSHVNLRYKFDLVSAFFSLSSTSKWSSTCPSTSFQQTCGRKSTTTTNIATRAKSSTRTTSWANSTTRSKRWDGWNSNCSPTFINPFGEVFFSRLKVYFKEQVKKNKIHTPQNLKGVLDGCAVMRWF